MSQHSVLRTGVTLAIIAAICTALVAATYQSTRDRIAANEKALLERSLQPALAGLVYDSDVTESRVVIQPPHDLPGSDAAFIYRVFNGGEPVAALFVVTARDGYAGPIRLLVGVGADGVVTGLRILEHRETPGLGDKIYKDADFVAEFSALLVDPEIVAVKKGTKTGPNQVDAITGATISAKAVVRIINEAHAEWSDRYPAPGSEPGLEASEPADTGGEQ